MRGPRRTFEQTGAGRLLERCWGLFGREVVSVSRATNVWLFTPSRVLTAPAADTPFAGPMAASGLVLLLVAAALSVPASATPVGSVFTCLPSTFNHTAWTWSRTNSDLVCSALGDLYYATNGTGWTNNRGWSLAAAGTPTDYCNFYVGSYGKEDGSRMCTQGSDAAPIYMCVALIARLHALMAGPDSFAVT